MIGSAVIGFKTINRLNIIQSDWLEFRHATENKGQSLSQIRNYFGFGGFIGRNCRPGTGPVPIFLPRPPAGTRKVFPEA